MNKPNIDELKKTAKEFRRDILEMTTRAGSGHPGGSLSSVELMISLYGHKMKYDPKNPQWDDRDRLIISKTKGRRGCPMQPFASDA